MSMSVEALAPQPPPQLGYMHISYSLDSVEGCRRLRDRGCNRHFKSGLCLRRSVSYASQASCLRHLFCMLHTLHAWEHSSFMLVTCMLGTLHARDTPCVCLVHFMPHTLHSPCLSHFMLETCCFHAWENIFLFSIQPVEFPYPW